jgi:tungstate transport system ATP-binding protein
MSALLQVRGLRVRRAGVDVLQVDALDVQAGEVLALVGPNGSGKTTLLLALAQLLGRQQGQISYLGRSIDKWDKLDYRRRISFVFQNALLLDMSVEENVALGLKFRGLPEAVVRERTRHWVRRFEIHDLARRRAVELSGGEAQRVSLARAFALEPQLLFLDEPFPGLDPPARESLIDDLAELLEEDHRTAILVTHNLKEAAKLADRVAVIVAGKLRQVGKARQIKAHPADKDVAAFLRSMPR